MKKIIDKGDGFVVYFLGAMRHRTGQALKKVDKFRNIQQIVSV